MDLDWKKIPCRIDEITQSDEIEYIMALDENGTSTLKNLKEGVSNNLFTVTASVINIKDFQDIAQSIIQLKNKYWENGLFEDKKVVFHSREIRRKIGAFNPNIINYGDFANDLSDVLSKVNTDLYSANIDKLKLVNNYFFPHDPYDLSIQFILERFNFKLRRENANGLIFLESRGKKEDKELHSKICYLLKYGNNFQEAGSFEHIKGVYFNPKRTKDNTKSYWQLELADMFSYPIHRYVKEGTKDKNFKSFEHKIHGYPYYSGKGLKIFPL